MEYIFIAVNPIIKSIYFVIAVIIALLAGIITEHYRRKRRISKTQSIAVVLLTVYIFLIFSATVFSRTAKSDYSYELIPFWSYKEILSGSESLFWQDILNVIMLIPMGIMGSVIIGDCEEKGTAFKKVVFVGFLTSFSIEVLQLILKRGLFEFDDMFHNTIGVVIGCWIYWKMRKKE